MFNGFGDEDGQQFGLDFDEPMGTNAGFDENMNAIMDIPDIDLEPIQSPHVDTTQLSTHPESGHETTKTLLSNLSSLSSSIVARKKKSTTNKRRTTLMVDDETEIPTKIMKMRTSK